MAIRPENYKWVILAVLVSLVMKNFQKPVAIAIIILSLPNIYHLIKRDGQTNPIGYLTLLGGIGFFWYATR